MKVLVLEESQLARRFIQDEIVLGGYEVLEAASVEEALDLLSTVNDIAMMTLQVVLKDMSGFDFVEMIRSPEVRKKLKAANNQDVPTMFVTSMDNDRDRLRGFQVGAADFIQKPWPSGELLAHVNQVLGTGSEFEGLSVLIVDDSPIARSFISISVQRLGVTIHEADDGDTALEFLRARKYPVDLVITDLKMVRMNGDELCLKIRRELGLIDLPVIFLSGTENRDTVLSMFKIGATDYLTKPFLQEELLARMRAYLDRVQSNRSLIERMDQLQNLNKVKDDFLNACSHDLRSPLEGIHGYTDLLLGDEDASEWQKEMLAGIQSPGNYLLELLGDLEELGRIESGNADRTMEPVDLMEILDKSTRTLEHTAGPKNVEVTIIPSEEPAVIQGNRSALTRICNNLLSNAIKFTPAGGQVVASLRVDLNGELVLAIRDTGIGMSEDEIPKLFERFNKTSAAGTDGEKGSGLGLVIVKELVDVHKGTISVESIPDQGTTFSVVLPGVNHRAESSVDTPVAAAETAPISIAMPGDPDVDVDADADAEAVDDALRILLADDDAEIRVAYSQMLGKMGFHVDQAVNGQEAVEMYKKSVKDQRYDVILMDLTMPSLNGLTASKRIRKFESGRPRGHICQVSPVVILAMADDEFDGAMGECLSAGMNDVLTKPLKKMGLYKAIDSWTSVTAC